MTRDPLPLDARFDHSPNAVSNAADCVLLGYLGPIDPVTILRSQWAAQGVYLNEEEVAELRSQYGLDRPFHEQFGTYMGNLLQGKFGYSFLDAAPIWPRIKRALPVSGQLALGVLAIMAFIGIPLGVIAARFHNTWLDYSIVSGSLFFWSIPPYVLVPVILIVAVLWLDIMNVPRGWKGVWHPILFCSRGYYFVAFTCRRYSPDSRRHSGSDAK